MSNLLNLAEIKDRGRALVAAQPLVAGQIILRDSPILLYSALPLTTNPSPSYCSHCFKTLKSSNPPFTCPNCTTYFFCSSNCLSTSISSSHTPYVCQSLCRLSGSQLPTDREVQARFLISAINLAAVSPSNFEILLSLQGGDREKANGNDDCNNEIAVAAMLLHSVICSICPPPGGFLVELCTALLWKDKLNAFGLMEPFDRTENGERSVRAYGIYPKASFFNHDCLPNACRFDYVDNENSSDGSNTDIIIRMIHDVPQGREICLSYFPVNLNYGSRQKRLLEDYGFKCECDRCKVEANWSDNEDGDENEVEQMEEDNDEEMAGSEETIGDEGQSDFPHAYFFVRYMCNRDNCWGTLAPLPPSVVGPPSNILECNVCGQLRNADEEGEMDV